MGVPRLGALISSLVLAIARGGSPGRLDIFMYASLLGRRYHSGACSAGCCILSAASPFTDAPLLAGRKTRARAHTFGHQCVHFSCCWCCTAGRTLASALVSLVLALFLCSTGAVCFRFRSRTSFWFLCWCLWLQHWFCTGPVSLCILMGGAVAPRPRFKAL